MESINIICTVHDLYLCIISNIYKIYNDLTVKNNDQSLILKSLKIETKSTTIGFNYYNFQMESTNIICTVHDLDLCIISNISKIYKDLTVKQ